MNRSTKSEQFKKEISYISDLNGIFRTANLCPTLVNPVVISRMVKAGVLDKISYGLYRLKSLPPLKEDRLFTVAMRAPNAVVCLSSALAIHGLTRYIPDCLHVALKRDVKYPKWGQSWVRWHSFSGKAYSEGIEAHKVDGITVAVYSPEKTLSDCVKYRKKLGVTVVVDAFVHYFEQPDEKKRVEELIRMAEMCRQTRNMKPYLRPFL